MIDSKERGKPMRPLFYGALAAVFALYFVPIASAKPTDACQEARAQDKRVVAEVTDPRVLTAVAAAVEVSGFQQHVVACEISIPYLSATVEKLENYYYVGVTKMLVEYSTDAELRAAVGHEIAHIVLGHRTSSFELTHIRTAKYEQEADALSALWFGKAGMRSLLIKLRVDAMRLPKPSQRRHAIAEIAARIKALQ
jgi:Zn-dependent protease with chaperone function